MAEVVLGILYALGLAGLYNLSYAIAISDNLVRAFWVTVGLVAVVIPVGFLMGFLVGWARTAHSWTLRAVGTTYVEFFRGMPPIVLVFFSWLIATLVFRRVLYVEDPFAAAFAVGVLALGLHSASYQAEIVRAGIQSVPAGQVEAADALGMTRWQTMFRVILPQAFRVSLPALGNEFSSVIKDTSILSAISALELTLTGMALVNGALYIDRNLVFVIWTEVALLYLLLTFLVTRLVRAVENTVKVPGLEAAQL